MIQTTWAGALVVLLAASATQPTAGTGIWSAQAQAVWPGHRVLNSPHGHLIAEIDQGELRLGEPGASPLETIPVSTQAELLWAPTSDSFVITESDGGAVGTWSIMVYSISSKGLTSSQPTDLVIADFKKRFPKCPDEFPNVAAVSWLQATNQIAVVAQMPCQSSCSDMCKILGYIIDPVTGVIARRLRASEVHKEWAGALGPALRESR